MLTVFLMVGLVVPGSSTANVRSTRKLQSKCVREPQCPSSGVVTMEFRGAVELPQDLMVDGYTFGGISGMAYDAANDLYYAVGDDLSNARYHTLKIDLSDGMLDEGDVVVESSVLFNDIDQKPFTGGSLDPEGIVLLNGGTLMMAAEPVGDLFPAFIREYSLNGTHLSAFPTDHLRYDPRYDSSRGTRGSGGYESLFLSPDGETLFAAFEKPLKQDMEVYDNKVESPVRVKTYDLATKEKTSEMVYMVGTMTIEPIPADGWYGRGLNDLMYLEEGRFLSVERQYAQTVTNGVGSRPVEVFEVTSAGATDVSQVDALTGDETPMTKTLVMDFEALVGESGVTRIGSHEVLLLGPDLDACTKSLIMIEDNDFDRPTQVLVFALTM